MIFESDILNECLRNADASSRVETYNKMFGNISSLASSITEDKTSDSSSMMPLFPLAMKVASKTIGYDLVSVSPIDDEFSEITEDGELIEPEYEGMAPPSGKLFYMDFKQP